MTSEQLKKHEFPNLPDSLSGLADLANNLWWSWHPSARMLFKGLDRQAWKNTSHNPVLVLKTVPPAVLESAANDPQFMRHYRLALDQFRRDLAPEAAVALEDVIDPQHYPIAYFSAEYGLHHSLPFYAGGLGFLAGDFLKQCSDMGIPVVAVGFMYPSGYVHQHLTEDGWQVDVGETLDREAASISRVLGSDGKQVVVRVPFMDPPIFVAVWKIEVGRVPLYLLDTDIEENDETNRKISDHLYVADYEKRLRQEIVLGIGGTQVLQALGITHSVLHLNEGHAAFALLERVRERLEGGLSYGEAVARVRDTSVFTTHTSVPAGHDIFSPALMDKYFRSYWPSLGLDRDSFFRLGANPDAPAAGFNMTALALRLSGFRNGVSQKHAEVARRMWKSLWPGSPEKDVPIVAITNGVHVPTWTDPKFQLLYERNLDASWAEDNDSAVLWELVDDIPDEEFWKTHYWLKIKLIAALRERTRRRWSQEGIQPIQVVAGGTMLDHSIFTIGFARRFATYKRANLIFHDRARLKKLLNDPWCPVQIIFAGKAHPDDGPGKRILQEIYNAARDPEMGGHIAFVEDYGELLAQYLTHGVDLWLNNPLPPNEACGTSGMKAALNGVPQLSIWDGWWIEGYNGKNGWVFGQKDVPGDRTGEDAAELFDLLEKEIVPRYYDVSGNGVPHRWVEVMKEAVKSCAPRFSAMRMVKDYLNTFYIEALKKA